MSGHFTKLAQFRLSISIGNCRLRRTELVSQAGNFKLLFVSRASPSEAGFLLVTVFAAGYVQDLEDMVENSFDVGTEKIACLGKPKCLKSIAVILFLLKNLNI